MKYYKWNQVTGEITQADIMETESALGNPLKRIVGLNYYPGGVNVSTVFLAIDHSFNGGTPVLFETMIFGGEHDGYQERYTSFEEAVKGHEVAVKLVRGE
jgi:hypothetical protein